MLIAQYKSPPPSRGTMLAGCVIPAIIFGVFAVAGVLLVPQSLREVGVGKLVSWMIGICIGAAFVALAVTWVVQGYHRELKEQAAAGLQFWEDRIVVTSLKKDRELRYEEMDQLRCAWSRQTDHPHRIVLWTKRDNIEMDSKNLPLHEIYPLVHKGAAEAMLRRIRSGKSCSVWRSSYADVSRFLALLVMIVAAVVLVRLWPGTLPYAAPAFFFGAMTCIGISRVPGLRRHFLHRGIGVELGGIRLLSDPAGGLIPWADVHAIRIHSAEVRMAVLAVPEEIVVPRASVNFDVLREVLEAFAAPSVIHVVDKQEESS
ncbi:MAG: hypothetical protein LLG01_17665 [Planctomycetaceae bacterium]|nr:hypothetical protein [Planctomycetaceae bacterium]